MVCKWILLICSLRGDLFSIYVWIHFMANQNSVLLLTTAVLHKFLLFYVHSEQILIIVVMFYNSGA